MEDARTQMGRQSEAMSDRELVRAVTVGRAEFAIEFRDVALTELERRGLSVEGYADFAWVGHPQGPNRRSSIAEALEVTTDEMPLWRLFLFGNCLDEALVIQRERSKWTVHHYLQEVYHRSFFLTSRDHLCALLDKFLRLESWSGFVEGDYNFDDWEIFEHSTSREQIEQLANELTEGDIPHTVKPPSISRGQDEAFALLVHPDFLDAADDVVSTYEGELEQLYRQAAEMASGADPRQELAVYDQLAATAPTNPAVFYNRGSLLMELGRYEEAAQSLTEAVSLGAEETQRSLPPGLNQGAGGGLFGLVVTLFKKAIVDSEKGPPPYPDYIDDAEMLLQQILQRLPKNIRIVHCLASICRIRHDATGAATHYEYILKIEPEDRIALFYLGYLEAASGVGPPASNTRSASEAERGENERPRK